MNIPAKDPREWYAITKLQYDMLRQWSEGDFVADYDPAPPKPFDELSPAEQAAALDKAALDNTIGGPFHPGCEMTWPMRQAIMYAKPFRLKLRQGPPKDYGDTLDSKVALGPGGPLDGSGPGDVSRWMAVPWQTDTSSCLYAYTGWQENVFLPTFWPVRVPNNVLTKEQFDVITDAKRPYAERFDAFDYRTASTGCATSRRARTTPRRSMPSLTSGTRPASSRCRRGSGPRTIFRAGPSRRRCTWSSA